MSVLSVYSVAIPEVPSKMLIHADDIAATLADVGVRYQQRDIKGDARPGASETEGRAGYGALLQDVAGELNLPCRKSSAWNGTANRPPNSTPVSPTNRSCRRTGLAVPRRPRTGQPAYRQRSVRLPRRARRSAERAQGRGALGEPGGRAALPGGAIGAGRYCAGRNRRDDRWAVFWGGALLLNRPAM